MENSIRNFAEQFNFEPKVENEENLHPAESFVVGGMGGSRLSAGILQSIFPDLDLIIHKNYGLPAKKLDKSLFIASSFSGNTEEVLDFLEKAMAQKLNTAVISSGGKLLQIAQENKLPFIQLPNEGIQPRIALGYSTLALFSFIKKTFVPEPQTLARILNPLRFEDQGEELARTLKNKIPIIYSSEQNKIAAEIWKINFNETGKIPAFCNVLPELNHNEMTSFDHNNQSQLLSENFSFVLLHDSEDHPRIKMRMEVLTKILERKELPTKMLEFEGEGRAERIFNSVLLSCWTALYTARLYGAEPEEVPMVEKFKNLISD